LALEDSEFSFPGRPRKPEHSLGNNAATVPDMQISAKIEPTRGFLKVKFSSGVDAFSANIDVVSNPRIEMLM